MWNPEHGRRSGEALNYSAETQDDALYNVF